MTEGQSQAKTPELRVVPEGQSRQRRSPRSSATSTVGDSDPAARTDELQSAAYRPIRQVNAFEEAIEQVLRLIRLGVVLPGERLLPERELAEKLGVSRPTVREAIRALSHTGYLETRRGRNGGAFVVEQRVRRTSRVVRRFVAENGPSLLDALDFRFVVEPGAAALAAIRATAQDRLRLEQAMAELAATPRDTFPSSKRAKVDQPEKGEPRRRQLSYRMADQRLHLLIATITRSPTVTKVVGEAHARISELIALTPQVEGALRHSDEQHLNIVDAICRGDGRAARSAMEEHVEATAAYVRGFLS